MKLLVLVFSLLMLAALSLTDDECGKREAPTSRIVGGEEALSGSWPWMAAIIVTYQGRIQFQCGGSLVGPRHILSAAHCFFLENDPLPVDKFYVRLGDVNLGKADEPSDPQTFGIMEVHTHENYTASNFYNDIAVVMLDGTPKRSYFVIPLCLPSPSAKSNTFEGQNATAVGWGFTDSRKRLSAAQLEVEVPVWRNDKCNNTIFPIYKSNVIPSLLCAGYTDVFKSTCRGDSGGPLMLESDGHWMQIGVVSFGAGCGDSAYPAVYTRVTEYLDWIKQKMQD